MKIQDMHPSLRPRERAIQIGVENLTDRELLAIMLRTGSKSLSALELADQILERCGSISAIPRLSMCDLMTIKGIKIAKATEFLAIIEIAKRLLEPQNGEKIIINDASAIVKWLNIKLGFLKQEQFLVISMNQNHEILRHRTLFVGTLDRSLVHPRDIIREVSAVGAMKVIFVHNHPGGTMVPSRCDIDVTVTLIEACRIVGVEVYDHIIITQTNYISLRIQLPELFLEL